MNTTVRQWNSHRIIFQGHELRHEKQSNMNVSEPQLVQQQHYFEMVPKDLNGWISPEQSHWGFDSLQMDKEAELGAKWKEKVKFEINVIFLVTVTMAVFKIKYTQNNNRTKKTKQNPHGSLQMPLDLEHLVDCWGAPSGVCRKD